MAKKKIKFVVPINRFIMIHVDYTKQIRTEVPMYLRIYPANKQVVY